MNNPAPIRPANPSFPSCFRPGRWTTGLLLLGLVLSPAQARQNPTVVEAIAGAFVESHAHGLPGQVEVEMGEFDPNNQLPPCASLSAFFPPGTRAWGQISVGVRCDSPVAWTVYLPARVRVVTDYLVVARPIRPGQIIGPDDVRLETGDLAAQPSGTLTDLSQVIGHHARIAIASGNTLRNDMLRLPPAIRQGETVKVVAAGAGFSISNEGRALNRAGEGEPVRVRMSNGQIVSGIARAGGVVEVRF